MGSLLVHITHGPEAPTRAALGCLVAAHISEKNNHPDIVGELIRQLDGLPEPVIADQETGFGWIDI